ncbi:QueT transporter family protein [Orenia marismortui]|uniref:QueT transporter family protein n=1 Tax=Orenia marismortui TaxID=46469 RepID=UPI00036D8BE9|nr:QueT transporter family protein [Orenia marismortui]
MNTKKLTRAGIIAAIYVVITYLLAPFSFGPIQVRVAEGLTLLPIIFPESIWGLFIGCFIANYAGGMGAVDIIGGSLVTLLAAFITYKYRNSIIAYLSPILANGFLVSIYVHKLAGWPYWYTVGTIALGEAIAILIFGLPLIKYLKTKFN